MSPLMFDLVAKSQRPPPAATTNDFTGRGCKKYQVDGQAFNKTELADYLGVTFSWLKNQLTFHDNDVGFVVNKARRIAGED